MCMGGAASAAIIVVFALSVAVIPARVEAFVIRSTANDDASININNGPAQTNGPVIIQPDINNDVADVATDQENAVQLTGPFSFVNNGPRQSTASPAVSSPAGGPASTNANLTITPNPAAAPLFITGLIGFVLARRAAQQRRAQ